MNVRGQDVVKDSGVKVIALFLKASAPLIQRKRFEYRTSLTK